MATEQEQLQRIKTQTLGLIAELTANPKPSYQLDGQEVAWTEYLRQLRETVAWCDQRLAAEEPFEIHSQGCT